MNLQNYTVQVALFTLAYFCGFAIFVASTNQPIASWIQLAIMVLLIGIVSLVHRQLTLSRVVFWSLSLWGLIHLAGALIPLPADVPQSDDTTMLYSWYLIPDSPLRYDWVVHFIGFGVMTWACWEMLQGTVQQYQKNEIDKAATQKLRPYLSSAFLAVMASMGFGAFNEVIEFAASEFLSGVDVGGYENTAGDLVANMLGSIFAASILLICHRVNPNLNESRETD